jgi:hypothetical protein
MRKQVMKPIVTTALKHLSSLLKTDAPSGRANGTSGSQWDRSHFERWTLSQSQSDRSAPASRANSAKQAAADRAAFQRWTQSPSASATAGHAKAVRANLQTQARQTYALYYM